MRFSKVIISNSSILGTKLMNVMLRAPVAHRSTNGSFMSAYFNPIFFLDSNSFLSLSSSDSLSLICSACHIIAVDFFFRFTRDGDTRMADLWKLSSETTLQKSSFDKGKFSENEASIDFFFSIDKLVPRIGFTNKKWSNLRNISVILSTVEVQFLSF